MKVTFPVGPVEADESLERITEMSVSCCPPVSEVAEVVSTSVVGRNWTIWVKGAEALGKSV
jgi:hypothetical protein